MPKSRRDRPGQIGEYWLSRRGSEQWRRTWLDRAARQVRRASLGDEDFSDFHTAHLRLAEWVLGNQAPHKAARADVQLEPILVRYYELHAAALPSAEQAKIALGYWAEHFAGATVADVTRTRTDAMIAALLARGLSRGYVHRTMTVGRAALNWSWRREELESVPFVPGVETTEQRRSRPPRGRPLAVDEMVDLVGAIAEGPAHLQQWLVQAGCTLARPEAALELGVFAVDAAHGVLDLNPSGRVQTKKHRPILPIARTLAPWLQLPKPTLAEAARHAKRRRRQAVETDRFVQFAGRPVGSIKRAFREARQRAGLDAAVTPYSIRHTLARALRRAGVPKDQIQDLQGHRPRCRDATTEVYAPYEPGYCAAAVAAIDAYWDQVKALLFAGVHAAMAQQDDVSETRRSA